MTPAPVDDLEPPVSLSQVGGRVECRLTEMLDQEVERWNQVDADIETPLLALRDFIRSGGKRLRPAFCFWAFVGAGGDPESTEIIDVGAALEMLHTFALIHDDIMDDSDRRRNKPSVHALFITTHESKQWKSESRRFGEGAAILIGDLAAIYADVLFSKRDNISEGIFNELRIELCVGQYLDLMGTATSSVDPVKAARIEEYKSGKYTVERPLHLGAALAGRFSELNESLSAVGLPMGAAFQLRDDLLGVFGDSEVTGKPVGDDLREGKLTPLIAAAAARANSSETTQLQRIGHRNLRDDEIFRLQEILVSTGARDEVEREIKRLTEESMRALSESKISREARNALEELGAYVAWRNS